MNRRTFTKSLAALFAVPVLPALPVAAPAAVAEVPTIARFWAIYMAGLNGHCTPLTIQTAMNVSQAEAEGYIARLVHEGVINPRMQQVVREKQATARQTARRLRTIVIDNMARMPVGRAVGFA